MHFLRFPTFCSANRAPRLSDSACFEIADVTFLKQSDFWKKIRPWQRNCPGQVVSSKKIEFLENVLSQAAKLPRTSGFFTKNRFSGEKENSPRQRSCPRQVACSKKSPFWRNNSVPSSEAARDKWRVQQKKNMVRKSAPGSEAARGK